MYETEKGSLRSFPYLHAGIALLLGVVLLLAAHWSLPLHPLIEEILQEVGFALVVAVIIWSTFEVFSQQDAEEKWKARVELIAKNVFFGVFRRNFPPGLIHEANILVLEHNLVRGPTTITYSLRDKTYTDRYGVSQKFVELSARLRFKIKNIGDAKTIFEAKVGMPNPIIDELKEFSKVKTIQITGSSQTEIDKLIANRMLLAQDEFKEKLKNDSSYMVPFKVCDVSMAPGEEIEATYEYSMPKEEDDTEICQTLYPMESVNITVVDWGPTRRIVRARSIHHVDLENDSPRDATGTYNYHLARYLLPHQGFAIWWKRLPEPQSLPPEETRKADGNDPRGG
ncbi:MAG: hypothetical protein WCF81_17565 [Roseiarcus sp.]